MTETDRKTEYDADVTTTVGAEVEFIVEMLPFSVTFKEERFDDTVVEVVWLNFTELVGYCITCEEFVLTAGIKVGINEDKDVPREFTLKDGDSIMLDVVFSIDAVELCQLFNEPVRVGSTSSIEELLKLGVSGTGDAENKMWLESLDLIGVVTVFELKISGLVIFTIVDDVCIAFVSFGLVVLISCLEGFTIACLLGDDTLESTEVTVNAVNWPVNDDITDLTWSECITDDCKPFIVTDENWLLFTGIVASNDWLVLAITNEDASSWPYKRGIKYVRNKNAMSVISSALYCIKFATKKQIYCNKTVYVAWLCCLYFAGTNNISKRAKWKWIWSQLLFTF